MDATDDAGPQCQSSTMVVQETSNLLVRVRFPSLAPTGEMVVRETALRNLRVSGASPQHPTLACSVTVTQLAVNQPFQVRILTCQPRRLIPIGRGNWLRTSPVRVRISQSLPMEDWQNGNAPVSKAGWVTPEWVRLLHLPPRFVSREVKTLACHASNHGFESRTSRQA